LLRIRDELTEKKTIEGDRTREIIEELRAQYPKDVGAPGPEVKLGTGAGTVTDSANSAEQKKTINKKQDE
jgi:cell division protease FtsH